MAIPGILTDRKYIDSKGKASDRILRLSARVSERATSLCSCKEK
jgi:hypothetical protein